MSYTDAQAIKLIEKAFPALIDDLHGEIVEDLLHPQIGEFSRLAQAVVDDGDKHGWAKVTATFMELWLNSDPSVINALNVSFLEHLNFKDGDAQRSWALDAMPLPMRRAWQEMDVYNRKLHGG